MQVKNEFLYNIDFVKHYGYNYLIFYFKLRENYIFNQNLFSNNYDRQTAQFLPPCSRVWRSPEKWRLLTLKWQFFAQAQLLSCCCIPAALEFLVNNFNQISLNLYSCFSVTIRDAFQVMWLTCSNSGHSGMMLSYTERNWNTLHGGD